MFANFEISRAGLVITNEKPKHHRVNTGCLECRRRKKKCDEKRPVCGACSRYRRFAALKCCWPQAPSTPTATYKSSSSSSSSSEFGDLRRWESAPEVRARDSECPESGDEQLVLHRRTERSASFDATPSPLSLAESLPTALSNCFVSRPERTALQYLHEKFRQVTGPSYIDFRLSILPQALPGAVTHPAVKNAFVACGYALLANNSSSPERHQLAAEYYSKTVRIIREDLMNSPEEPMLSAVLLLHIFEDIHSETERPERLHLLGARALLQSSLSRGLPAGMHQHLLLEGTIYHIVTASCFYSRNTKPLPEDYISDLLELLQKSSDALGSHFWKNSAIMGISQGFFDIMFRLQQLRQKLPLQADDLPKLAEVDARLKSWRSPSFDKPSGYSNREYPPRGMILSANLYHLACRLFLEKLSDVSLQADDSRAREILGKTVDVLSRMSDSDRRGVFKTLDWPLVVLACGAWTELEQISLRKPFESCWEHYKLGSAARALRVIEDMWTIDESKGRAPGLDVLLDGHTMGFVI